MSDAPGRTYLLDGPVSVADGWWVVEDGHDPDRVVALASSHLTGNGALAYRATCAGWEADATVGCVVHDTWDTAPGSAWTELCTVPDALWARWTTADGTPLLVAHDAALPDHAAVTRHFDTRHVEQHHRLLLELPEATLTLHERRFASLADRHLIVQQQRIDAPPGTVLTLETAIVARVWSLNGAHLTQHACEEVDGIMLLSTRTVERGLPITVGQTLSLTDGSGVPLHLGPIHNDPSDPLRPTRRLTVTVGHDGTVVATQCMVVVTGHDLVPPVAPAKDAQRVHAGVTPVRDAALARAREALDAGFVQLHADHAAAWDALWEDLDVRIDGDVVARVVLRFNLAHAVMATPMHAAHLPLGARGLSTQAYQGAAFWDQEMYNLPMWVHTRPEVARALLTYRHRTLDGSRRKAARLGYRGAFPAWVSGETGDELCPDFYFTDVHTGRPTRQHFNDWQMHVAPDLVVAIDRYGRTTGDRSFLHAEGAEIVFEVARFLASFVHLRPADGRHHLLRLLGPDEYHENVDDNPYSLEQSRIALDVACRLHDDLARSEPQRLAELRAGIGLVPAERAAWEAIRDGLVEIAPDPGTGVLEQFVGYHRLEDVRPAEVETRLLDPDEYWGWPAGVAVHTQVIKQADVIQLMMDHPDLHPPDVVAANLDHYLPRTQHGSSLSRPAHALVAARLGRTTLAEELFLRGAIVDLVADAKQVSGGTFIGGIHTAAAGGAWQVAVLGFGGVHVHDDRVDVLPRLPERWEGLGFRIRVRGCTLDVDVRHGRTTVRSHHGNPTAIEVRLADGDHVLDPGESASTV
jgi:trehalose/maltose hydrolase-like predicted phosphorylase